MSNWNIRDDGIASDGQDDAVVRDGKLEVVAALMQRAGYLIHAPGAEADRARSDAEIARLTVEAERCSRGGCTVEQEGEAIDARDAAASARIAADDAAKEGT